MAEEILETRALDALLLTDLASDGDTGPQVDGPDELRESAKNAAVPHGLCVLAEDVAGAEVGDDAGGAVVEATEDSVTPLARHGDWLVVVGSRRDKERLLNGGVLAATGPCNGNRVIGMCACAY